MNRCGYKWQAPHLLPPGEPKEIVVPGARVPVRGDRIYTDQECVLREGHVGPHRSMHNVITANVSNQDRTPDWRRRRDDLPY